jgi:hypothetical protein
VHLGLRPELTHDPDANTHRMELTGALGGVSSRI